MAKIIETSLPTDGKPCILIEGATILHIDDVKEGVSAHTGRPWKLRYVNLAINRGEGFPSDYVRVCFRNEACDLFASKNFAEKDMASLYVQFRITGGQWPRNEIEVITII